MNELLQASLRTRYVREGWVPLRVDEHGTTVGVSRPVRADAAARIGEVIAGPIRLVEVSQGQVIEQVLGAFGPQFRDEAADGLADRDPVLSARTVLSLPQKIGLVIAAVALVALAIVWPLGTLIGVLATASLVFLAGTVFKFAVSMTGSRYDQVDHATAAEIAAIDDADLPIYTVLVPVFREARVVARLVENLGRLDYPADKLEVLILVEEDDEETRQAINASTPPENFVIVTVPRGAPQTKPRACNVGLAVARGEFLVIYDAEDAPEPDQLKKTWLAFHRAPASTVVFQAALNYFNARENILTRMFSLEYSYWFGYMLPGLDVRDLPIPLGGTSNHFRTAALRELGGWDPYNVTEDADLGIRASALGYRVGVVDSTTMEEATSRIGIFIGQRSRWIKGYMQTSLVHARRPGALIKRIGLRRFAAFALLIAGTPLTFLGVIPFTALLLFTFIVPAVSLASVFPPLVLWLALLNFLVGNILMVYLNMMGPYKRGSFWLVGWALLNPVYWLLHSVASYKALWQLVTRPHYWEKTEHGLSTYEHPGGAEGAAAP